MDAVGADFFRIGNCPIEAAPLILTLPRLEGDDFTGVIDLITLKYYTFGGKWVTNTGI